MATFIQEIPQDPNSHQYIQLSKKKLCNIIGLQKLLTSFEHIRLKNEAIFVNVLKSDTHSNKKQLENQIKQQQEKT